MEGTLVMCAPPEASFLESGSRLRDRLDEPASPPLAGDTLDPAHWPDFRAQAHRMLDDILDYTEKIRQRPVWQPIPQLVREVFQKPLPQEPGNLANVHDTFLRQILPYSVGNAHPRFMGWVHGGGTPVGILAEMLAAGLNANLGGRDQIPIEVERQVVRWMRELFGFPDTASGLFVTGTSMANLIAVLVARTHTLGTDVRVQGMALSGPRLAAYASRGAHGSIAQAMDLAGLGSDALRLIPVNEQHQMDTGALAEAIARDKSAGLQPFFIAATAGTVDVGAIDDLAAAAAIAQREELWFHVDGAYGALAMLAPDIAPRLAGIERADSIAFDFHKWGQVPYDAGFVLARDGTLHHSTFASPAAYLRREARGMAAGSPWPCDFGPDLSRGFRALKTWFTITVYGAEQLGAVISKTCALAQYLKRRIETEPSLELLAPVALNIVCFRYRSEHADDVNREIAADLQESGIAAPSTTTVNDCLAIRTAIVNHRTDRSDIDALIEATIAFGAARKNRRVLTCRP
jgi:aromatic-L-amino-acid decarboxylase